MQIDDIPQAGFALPGRRIWPKVLSVKPRDLFPSALVRAWPLCLGWLLLVGAPARVPAELVLNDYSSARPLRVMAIGDSITDDCSINGAWRQYLQPQLEAAGYPFTFVGRFSSTPSPTFTKTQHEGICGAVIAPPGMMTTTVHGYAGPDTYLLKTVADALTNATPDLVLVVMGANDIGRGRNPYWVATNDMPQLLDLLFSNVPNANIIITKTTTLLNAVNGYSTYFTNVPVYNATLQVMVNARRAAGQNVFLADMYSVVDYSTGFLGDHLHPNATGLTNMAREFFTRIQAITRRPDVVTTTLIQGGSDWRYSDTGQDLGTNWTALGYDDSGWSHGPARLGYGDKVVATTVSWGADPTNRYPTTYFRRPLVVPDNLRFTNLDLRVSRQDGAVVWLNGQELCRLNMPSGPIAYTNLASSHALLDPAYTFYQVTKSLATPLQGTNVLAVELHHFLPTIPSIGFDLELIGTGFELPPPSLSFGLTATNLLLSWPATNANYALYSARELTATNAWQPVPVPPVTNNDWLTVPVMPTGQSFFRLQIPARAQ